jgi:hypothetical protein
MSVSTQLTNIETRTGKTLAQLTKLIESSGLTKHGELRQMLIDKLGMGFGDANTLIHHVRKSDGESAAAQPTTCSIRSIPVRRHRSARFMTR